MVVKIKISGAESVHYPLIIVGLSVILAPDFFIKSCENDTLINSYHAPGGF